jgi:hypothetical protein
MAAGLSAAPGGFPITGLRDMQAVRT